MLTNINLHIVRIGYKTTCVDPRVRALERGALCLTMVFKRALHLASALHGQPELAWGQYTTDTSINTGLWPKSAPLFVQCLSKHMGLWDRCSSSWVLCRNPKYESQWAEQSQGFEWLGYLMGSLVMTHYTTAGTNPPGTRSSCVHQIHRCWLYCTLCVPRERTTQNRPKQGI